MPRYWRFTLLAATLSLVVAAPVLAAAPAGAATTTAPLAAVDLHPDGAPPFERYVPSPVSFTARAAGDDAAGLRGREHYVVQRQAASGWQAAANVVGTTAAQIPLADGDVRWRARLEADDGTPGPWSSWIALTVDSRAPATPTVTIPDASVTVGAAVPVTITSPDGLAAMYWLSDQDVPLTFLSGLDPCRVPGVVCLAAGQRTVTVPWTFLEYGFPRLYVFVYGRNGLRSRDPAHEDPGLTEPDEAAAAGAARWAMPTTDSLSATVVADVQGGPGLRIRPAVTTTRQQLADHRTDPPGTTDVPSVVISVQTTARTTASVVDTASTFSVGAVLATPPGPHGDLTVLDQPGVGGPAFSLVLTSFDTWRFCVTTTAAETSCSSIGATASAPSDVVVGRYDAVRQVVSVSTRRRVDQVQGFTTIAPVRAATGGLRFGAAAVPGTKRYAGPIGSPFVAHGWITGNQVADLLAGSS